MQMEKKKYYMKFDSKWINTVIKEKKKNQCDGKENRMEHKKRKQTESRLHRKWYKRLKSFNKIENC